MKLRPSQLEPRVAVGAKPTEVTPQATKPASDAGVLFADTLSLDGKPSPTDAARMLDAVRSIARGERRSLEVESRPGLTVVGTDAAGAAAIAKEFDALVKADYARALPSGPAPGPNVFVLNEADFVRLMGPMAADYDARWVVDGHSAHLVLRAAAVERSKVDGTAVREALLVAMYSYNGQGYLASVQTGPTRGRLVRGSAPYPETLRAASDVDAFARVINLRAEDPDGKAGRRVIEKENARRATLGKPPIDYVHLPIRDYDVPTPETERRLIELFKDQRTTLVHCKAGIGRTGLVDAMIAIVEGQDIEEAVQGYRDWLPALRIFTEVTPEQIAYLRGFGARWKRGDFDSR